MPLRWPRELTLEDVPEEMVRGIPAAVSYGCAAQDAELIPLSDIRGPSRKLNAEALEHLIRRIRDHADIDPATIFHNGKVANLLDGMHRWRLSIACGFTHLPCRRVSREDAELLYRYTE